MFFKFRKWSEGKSWPANKVNLVSVNHLYLSFEACEDLPQKPNQFLALKGRGKGAQLRIKSEAKC
jgi:hypothetical protein